MDKHNNMFWKKECFFEKQMSLPGTQQAGTQSLGPTRLFKKRLKLDFQIAMSGSTHLIKQVICFFHSFHYWQNNPTHPINGFGILSNIPYFSLSKSVGCVQDQSLGGRSVGWSLCSNLGHSCQGHFLDMPFSKTNPFHLL